MILGYVVFREAFETVIYIASITWQFPILVSQEYYAVRSYESIAVFRKKFPGDRVS